MADDQEVKSEEIIDDECSHEVAAMQEQIQELESKYRRALADYQNLERQTAEANRRFAKIATEGFISELLVPYHHLLLAAEHLKDKGLDMVVSQFKSVFEMQGLKEIDALGKEFDPTMMEAVGTGTGEENKVVAVAQQGFELNGIVIAPAKVIVGKES
jgi:molecular chaperone GrpE